MNDSLARAWEDNRRWRRARKCAMEECSWRVQGHNMDVMRHTL
jgi:hypothetical protein